MSSALEKFGIPNLEMFISTTTKTTAWITPSTQEPNSFQNSDFKATHPSVRTIKSVNLRTGVMDQNSRPSGDDCTGD